LIELETEQRDRAALINKQDEMINALNNKVQQLAATV
jgi:DnaJ-domain-containing protein 1